MTETMIFHCDKHPSLGITIHGEPVKLKGGEERQIISFHQGRLNLNRFVEEDQGRVRERVKKAVGYGNKIIPDEEKEISVEKSEIDELKKEVVREKSLRILGEPLEEVKTSEIRDVISDKDLSNSDLKELVECEEVLKDRKMIHDALDAAIEISGGDE